jgi:hypothetical protein
MYIGKDLLIEILEYSIEDVYKIEPWICKLVDKNKFTNCLHFLKYKNSDYSEYIRKCFIKEYKSTEYTYCFNDAKQTDTMYIFDDPSIKSNKTLINESLKYIFWNENCIDIIEHILDNSDYNEFINEKIYVNLCQNIRAIDLIEKYIIKGNINNLTSNMLYYIVGNKNAISILEKYFTPNPYLITKYYYSLTDNSSAIHLLDKYLSRIDFKTYYEKRFNPIDRNILLNMCIPQEYKNGIDLNINIEEYIDNLCINKNIMCIIDKYLPYITIKGWYYLCLHSNTMDLIKNNLDKLDYDCWWGLWYNNEATSIILENKYKLDKRITTQICSNKEYVDIVLDNLDIHNLKHLTNILESQYMWKFIDDTFEIFDSVPNKWSYLCMNRKIGYFIDKYKPDLEQFDMLMLVDLCHNPNGFKYLEKITKKITDCITSLSCNPLIYTNIRSNIIKNFIKEL